MWYVLLLQSPPHPALSPKSRLRSRYLSERVQKLARQTRTTWEGEAFRKLHDLSWGRGLGWAGENGVMDRESEFRISVAALILTLPTPPKTGESLFAMLSSRRMEPWKDNSHNPECCSR